MEGRFVPVQYMSKNKKYNSVIVINNTQEDKDYVEELLCKMMGIKKTVGNVLIFFSLSCVPTLDQTVWTKQPGPIHT